MDFEHEDLGLEVNNWFLFSLFCVNLCFTYLGNSKYHYYGIRVKPGSPLARINDMGNTSGIISGSDSSSTPPAKRAKTSASIASSESLKPMIFNEFIF